MAISVQALAFPLPYTHSDVKALHIFMTAHLDGLVGETEWLQVNLEFTCFTGTPVHILTPRLLAGNGLCKP